MSNQGFLRRRGPLFEFLEGRRHTVLLVAIILTFAMRPFFGEGEAALVPFSVALILMLLVALYTTQVDELVGEREVLLAQGRRRRMIAWVLAIPALAERVVALLYPTPHALFVGAVCWFFFFAFVTWSLLRTLLRHRDVTGETIAMSVSIYLLLGVTWGVLYIAIFQRHPDAFSFGSTPGSSLESVPDRVHVFPVLIYFSMTTLSTIGFGDIVPLSLQARYAAVAEGIAGQFYLAILVARLVGMHMSRSSGAHDVPPM